MLDVAFVPPLGRLHLLGRHVVVVKVLVVLFVVVVEVGIGDGQNCS